MGMFDGLVLSRCLFVLHETLHATLYGYELVFIPSGVSVACLSAEDTPEESIFFGPRNHEQIMIAKYATGGKPSTRLPPGELVEQLWCTQTI